MRIMLIGIIIPCLLGGYLMSLINDRRNALEVMLLTLGIIAMLTISVAFGFNLVMNFWYGFGG